LLTFRDSPRFEAEITSDTTMKEGKQNRKHNAASSERRRGTRYQIRGAAWFQWEAEDGKGREGLGVTRDISTAGTFIEAPEGPAVGTRVKVVVTIASDVKNEMQLRLCGSRDVRHIDNGKEAQSGFGAWVGFHTDGAGSAEERQTSARCSSCPKDV